MPTKIIVISMSDKHTTIHHAFFYDYRYDNDLFLFLSVITQKKEDCLYPYYIRKSVRITAMPMTKVKNYLQSPALYPYIDMDVTLRTINKNIMEDKGDNIFGVNCYDPNVGGSEKSIAIRKKKLTTINIGLFTLILIKMIIISIYCMN